MRHLPRFRPRRVLAAPLLLMGVLASACGLRVDASTPEYQSFFTARVSAAGSNVAGAGGFAHGGIAPAPREAKPPAHLRPGEVYLGTTPLQTELPKAGRVTSVTYPQWAALFLPRIQAPVCGNNLVAMVAWQAQEGTRVAWNPLATTRGMPGAITFNSVGVKNYSSLEEGLQATALTLLVPAVIADFNRAFAPRSNRQ